MRILQDGAGQEILCNGVLVESEADRQAVGASSIERDTFPRGADGHLISRTARSLRRRSMFSYLCGLGLHTEFGKSLGTNSFGFRLAQLVPSLAGEGSCVEGFNVLRWVDNERLLRLWVQTHERHLRSGGPHTQERQEALCFVFVG
jgi:hypothetical protein